MAVNAVQTRALVTVIKAGIKSAWNVAVFVGKPGKDAIVPYGVIRIKAINNTIGQGAAAVGQVSQQNEFEIYGRWPNPSDASRQVDLEKIDRANELIAVLQASAKLRDANNVAIARLPLVSVVDPDVEGGDDDNTYMLSATFTCETVAQQHLGG